MRVFVPAFDPIVNKVSDKTEKNPRKGKAAPAVRPAYAAAAGPEKAATVRAIESLWQDTEQRFRGSYLSLLPADGKLMLHTAKPGLVGAQHGGALIETDWLDGPRTLRELAAAQRDWAGRFTNVAGQEQVAAFAYAPALDALVAIHIPAEHVDAEIHAAARPWAVGLTIITFLLLPAAVALFRVADSAQRNRLRHTEDQLLRTRFSMDQADVAILWFSPEGRIVDANAEAGRIPGQRQDQLLSMSARDIDPDFHPRRRRAHWRELRRLGRRRFEATIRTADAERLPVECRAHYVQFDGAEYDCTIGYDITERKRTEARRRQSQKIEALGALAGGIAHDFNNILTSILGYSQLAAADIPEKSQAYENLLEVRSAGRRAEDLVRRILTFSRRDEQERQAVEIGPIVEEAVKLMRASLPSTVRLDSKIDPDCGVVMADPTQIHQVVVNLCTNAYQAMGESGGELSVRLEPVQVGPALCRKISGLREGPYVRLSVADTGPGIEPSLREKIFEPFFTTKAPGEGTGLGLSVIHGIAKSHDGAIAVDEQTAGAAFHVFLPRMDDQVVMSEAPGTRADHSGTEHVLFVDDEETVARLGRRILTRLGYRVTAVSDPQEALALVREDPSRFDLVVTDVTMPHLTGPQLTAEISSLRPDLPVVLMSGFSNAVTVSKARRYGARAVIAKPFSAEDLGAIVRQALDERSKENG